MKTIRIVYLKWNGIDMRCTLEQCLSIPCSEIYIDIRAVSWSDTGHEFCGCIVHDNLPAVVQGVLPSNRTVLQYTNVPINHVKHYFGHKKVMRDEWASALKEHLSAVAHSNIEQHTLF